MHSWEEYNEAVQKVIELMHDDYPNGYIMEINGYSAELKSNISCTTYLRNDLNNFKADVKENKYKDDIYEDISD